MSSDTTELVEATEPRCPDCKGALDETGGESWRCPACEAFVEKPAWFARLPRPPSSVADVVELLRGHAAWANEVNDEGGDVDTLEMADLFTEYADRLSCAHVGLAEVSAVVPRGLVPLFDKVQLFNDHYEALHEAPCLAQTSSGDVVMRAPVHGAPKRDEEHAGLQARIEDLEAGEESWREQTSRLIGECNEKDEKIERLGSWMGTLADTMRHWADNEDSIPSRDLLREWALKIDELLDEEIRDGTDDRPRPGTDSERSPREGEAPPAESTQAVSEEARDEAAVAPPLMKAREILGGITLGTVTSVCQAIVDHLEQLDERLRGRWATDGPDDIAMRMGVAETRLDALEAGRSAAASALTDPGCQWESCSAINALAGVKPGARSFCGASETGEHPADDDS